MAGAVKGGSRPPWVGLGAAVWVQVAAGSAYAFPLYSHALKAVLGLRQQQVAMLGVANDMGENLGLVPGLLCNRLAPGLALAVGAAACFLGFGLLWLAVSRTLLGLPYWLLWIALYVGTNSSAWLMTAVLVTNMRNFPVSRGTVAGILKGYAGLSAAVFTPIYSGLLDSSPTKLLLFLALGLPAVCLAMMYFIRPCTPASDDDSSQHGHFLFTQICSVFLGIYLLTTTVLSSFLSLCDAANYILISIMVLFLLAPLAIPVKMTLFPKNRKKVTVAAPSSSSENLSDQDKSAPLLAASPSGAALEDLPEADDANDVRILLAEGEGAVKRKRRPRRGEDFKFKEAVVKADFWLLFVTYFFGVGSGVTVLNNLAQIGTAAGVDNTTVLLCIFSFCNFLGRLGGGAVSEHFVSARMLPRTIWMAVTQIIMIISYLLLASPFTAALYATTASLGLCYGVQFSAMIPTASELFGLKNFGMIYNFMLLGNPLGAFLFSGLLAGYIYDKEAAKQHHDTLLFESSSLTCLGPECFRLTFLVLAGVCCLGTLLSIVLTVRIRPVYAMLYSGGSFRVPRSSGY
ncbi:protein NUCLEAR FUSION DEFECTIVE 4-like [Ananas comosus]|uniref:Protein NUCLEAR FUSION DEFECTIVE 4-like n=1 Tax=Ananas comosus TaxID=4615 RepID=A0A6P5GYR0_ANACO|nr:protein NUCLEAR FUSION DEFECTIVE 4-like [Ananas comosus]